MRPEQQPIRVVVLDDHAVVQYGIATYFDGKNGIEVAASFTKSRELIQWLEDNQADVLLLDYTLGPDDMDGLNLIKLVNTRFPDCKILMTSSNDMPSTVNMTMRAGARGFFGKSENLLELQHAIHVVANGRPYISAELSNRMVVSRTIDPQVLGPKPVVNEDSATASSDPFPDSRLSPREHEVMRCYLAGMTVSDIAMKFARSRKTISAQKQAAFRKLGIRNDVELFASRKLLDDN
jgi:two-component system capsular synthesis response regulator RcsB